MKYKNVVEGIFIKRNNRFVAEVYIQGKREQVHVKNTGRCRELFIEGRRVYLEKSANPNRKTAYDLIAIEKVELAFGNQWINIDSVVPNAVVEEAIRQGSIEALKDFTLLKREVTHGKSRFDLYYENGGQKGYIEVKGVTLEKEGISMFPDAPTVRGAKHCRELAALQEEGYRNFIVFLVQMEGIGEFVPNEEMDPSFAGALREAQKQGVVVCAYNSIIKKDDITIGDPIRTIL